MTFRTSSIAAIAATLLVGACGAGPGDETMRLPKEGEPINPALATMFYTAALRVKQRDGCSGAVPVLGRLAEWGRGYEIVQYQLGIYLLELASAATDPMERQDSTAKGFTWVLLAGNSNNVNAQGKLAELYLNGIGTEADKIEAGKWYLLYDGHAFKREIGAKELAPDVEDKLNRQLTLEDWQEARQRVAAWEPTIQDYTTPAPDQEFLKPGTIRRRGDRH